MSDTIHNLTDDQCEAVARHMMTTRPIERTYWLAVCDEACSRPPAPYRGHCRRELGVLHHTLQASGFTLP